MFHTLKRLKAIFPSLNRWAFTEDDCYQICRSRKIIVKRAPLEVHGYSGKMLYRKQKRYYILIDEKLKGIEFLRAFLHEIGHILLHEPRGNLEVLYLKRDIDIETKQEAEADVFMLLAILPKKRFFELRETPFELLHPFTVELLKKREKLYQLIKE